MKSIFVVFTILLSAISYSASANDQADIIGVVLVSLKDPGSAKFGQITLVNDGMGACVAVNAKNAYGGYNGYQQAALVNLKGAGWQVVNMFDINHEMCKTILSNLIKSEDVSLYQSGGMQSPENKRLIPNFSDYGTDMQSISSYLRLMDSTSINACREALESQSMESVYCLSRHSSGDDHLKSLIYAAKLGHPLAKNDLAILLSSQKNPEFSAEIHQLMESAALSGIPYAQVSLGWWSMTGEHGFPVDYAEAMSWNLKAYNQGHSEGANNIGELYEKGLGVPKDIEKAASWYKKASVLGNKEATQRLGQMGK